MLYQFLRTAVTNYHILSGLTELAGLPSEGSEGDYCRPLSGWFAGHLWQPFVCRFTV